MKDNDPFFLISENIDSGRMSQHRWVEESYHQDWDFGSASAEFLSLSLSRKKLWIFFLLISGLMALLLGRIFYLQVVRGDYYFSQAENNRVRVHYLLAPRGIIYDSVGQPLVHNVSGFSLVIVPADLPKASAERAQAVEKIATLANLPVDQLTATIAVANQYYYQPLIVKTGIGYEEAMRLKIESAEIPSVDLALDAWRSYLYGAAFSQVLGYVGKLDPEEYASLRDKYLLSDNIGKSGLEKYYESDLRGSYGQVRVEVDSLGREKKIISQTPYVAGSDLQLSINVSLQNKIYEILEAHLHRSKSASVIVSDPRTGAILALVDYPSYDNNLFAQGISQADYQNLLTDEKKPLFMRSITGEFPSGSTVKIVEAAAALQEKIIDKNTTVSSVGGIRIGQWFFPDWLSGGHGLTNVTKAIAQSVNTFFYYIGGGYGDFTGLGVDLLAKYFRLFGLGEKLGLDLPGEQSGFVPTPEWKKENRGEIWYIGDTYHLAIGQGDLLVTPLQVNSYTAAIANGGTLYQPHLVQAIRSSDGVVRGIAPQVIRDNMVSPENIKIVQAGMRETVISGSARSLSVLPVAVAGKTGTAQWSSTKPNHAWFTSFAPYGDPTFCLTVLVEEGGEGSAIATPIARDIYQFWFGPK